MAKAKRNDPCPCGSGKKYKKCCWKKDARKEFTATIISDITHPQAKDSKKLVNHISGMFSKLEHIGKSLEEIEADTEAFSNAEPAEKNDADGKPESLKDKILKGKRPPVKKTDENDEN